ncbi:MAG: beta strand repeat-containing protein, partial [Flavobacteriia bacterium]
TYTYVWTVPSGVTNPGNISSFTTTVAGNYSVVITNTATNCASLPGSGAVTVNALPTVSVNSPSACTGSSATVIATPGSAGTYNYVWSVPSGATDPGNVASFSTTIAGNYSVIITNTTTNCVSLSALGTVSILANAPINAGGDVAICAGASITITATGGTSYNWVGLGTNSFYSVSPATMTTYTVTGSDANGCVGSDDITVTVNPNPTVSVNSVAFCGSTPATIVATPLPAGTYDYAWTVPTGASNPGNVPTFNTSVNGSYSVVITDPTTQCFSIAASGTVAINPNPSATVNSPTACAGSPASVTATPGTAGTYNYVWTVPTGAPNPGNASNFNATVSGTYTVVLTNTTTGCVSQPADGVVTINPIPVITLAPTDPGQCNATDGFIQVSGTGTGTVSWTGTATGSTAAVTLPYTISSLGAGNYSVTFTNTSSGCVSTAVSTTLNNPGAPVINAMPNLVTCGTSITINESSITGTNLSANLGFFSSPNGVGPIADGTTYTSPTPTTTVYVYDVNGLCSAQISFTVTVNTIPSVSVNSPTFCGVPPATLTATPGTPGNYTYAWTVPTGATNPGNSATLNTGTNGSYGVTVTNTVTGCVSPSATGTVTINANPTVSVNSSTVCAGTPATVTATPGVAAVYNYVWNVPAGATPPGNVATFSTSTAGTYSVVITNTTTGCVSQQASGTVTVNPLPTATIAGTVTLCQNEAQPTVTFTGANGTAPYTFTYNLNNGANQTIT